jgi:site-specific recombinase XerD
VARLHGDAVPLASLLPSWVLHLEAENRSPNTITTYTGSVRALLRHAQQAGYTATTDIGTVQLRAFQADVLKRCSPSTAATHHRDLGVFFTWLSREEPSLMPVSPMAGLGRPHVPRKRKPALEDDDLRKLLAAAAGNGFEARRDTAIQRVLMDTGMRISSLAGLQLNPENPEANDVLLSQKLLIIRLKGGKVIGVPVGRKACAALDRYIRARARHPQAEGTTALWIGLRGALTATGMRAMLERRALQAGVHGVHPHRYRRTLAHNWLKDGGTELDLMAITGWSTRAMIDLYAGELAEGRARAAHARLSPGDRI